MNLIYLSVVCISPIVGMIFIYNIINFLKNKRELKNIDIAKVRLRIKKHRISSIYSAIVLGILLTFIGIYTRDVNLKRIINLNDYKEIEKIVMWGNITGVENKVLEEDFEGIINTLNNYKYSRTFDNNDFGGNVQFLDIIIGEYEDWELLEVWEAGYLRLPTGEIYKINSENKEDLYEDLTEEMKKWN